MKKFLALLLSAMMILSCFAGMTFNVVAEENAEQTSENLVIPQDKWTVSGHCAQIVHKEGHGNSPMVAAGGIESGALLHQGAVGIGEIDLSKYSKAIISYGIDNSPVTVGHYEANANNRIMLSKVDNHMSNAPAEEDIIASATYTLEGWSLVTIEIDLTEVDYNGPVFVTYDTLPGTFMLIGKIEFVPAPATDYDVPMDTWTVSGHASGLTSKDKDGVGPMVAAGGLDVGALLHQGAVGVGKIDLSKYEKAVISYGIDNSPVTVGHYEANANNRIMLSKTDNNMTNAPAEEDIIASATYTLEGWSLVTVEIDLTDVDYNGPVYVTYDTLPGTFMLIGKIEFLVPAAEDEGPVYEERTINLGLGNQGGPFSGAPNYNFGQRYDIGVDVLKGVSILNMATYSDGGVNKWNFKVWQWNTDYATTVAGTPLFDQSGENHNDNATFSINIPTELDIRGDIYYEITYVEGPDASKTFTGWTADGGPAAGVETYVAGEQRTDGTYRATLKVIGLPLPPDPNEESTECLFAYDFSKYSENFTADQKVGSPNETVITELCNSGYVTLESKGGDPYFILGNAPTVPASQSDYVVIKYRTSTANATGEIYTARSDGLNWAAPMEKTHVDFAYVADGQWHTLIIDASGVWGDSKDANLTNFRFDFLKSAGTVDVSYIKFFATLEGAEACVAAETKEVALSGEYIDGDDAIIIVGGGAYAADKWVKLTAAENGYTDAEGNGYTVRADGVIFDANGFDTGMHLFVDDEGTPYGAAHYFALEYQDPAAGAVEIDGTKYTYTTKVALTPKMEPVDPENEIVTATYDAIVTHVSTDTIYIGSDIVASGPEVPAYIIAAGSVLRDTNKAIDTMTFRGWVGHNESPVAQFGYAFDNGEPVWGEYKEATEDPVKAAGGGENSQRFAIKVDISGLSEAKHSLYLLVKYEDGTIVTMNNIWTNLIIVKGGSWKQVGYTDGTNTYVKAEDGSVTINGEAATGKLLATDDGANYYDGVAALDENAKGKYLYNVTLTYTVDPEIPVNPAELKPVYLIDGEMLNVSGGQGIADATYDYENGCITYTATAPDPNTHGQNFVPAGTILGRYLVLKYRTSSEGAQGECFVGTGVGASGPDNVRYPAYITDGEWHTLIADLSVSKEWSADGLTNHFRNDILIDKGHSIDIEYYAFFNTMKEATYYAENDCHVLPKAPVYYTITFKADGEVVKEFTILEGTTSVKEPKVPEKEGYTGAWEEYTITGDADQTINAVYTEIGGTETPEYTLTDPSKLTTFPKDVFEGFFTNPSMTDVIYNDDGSVTFKGNWKEDTGNLDAFVNFNYSALMRKYVDSKLQNVPNKNGEYGALVLKVKADAAIAGNFKLYFAMGRGNASVSEDNSALADIDAIGTGDYEYIIFDLSYTTFVDDVIGSFRLDWVDNNTSSSADNVGASLTLYEINLYKDIEEAMIACGMEIETEPTDTKPQESEPADTNPQGGEDEPQATQPQETQPPKKEKGCKSVVASASLMTLVAAACAAVALKKKKED